MTENLTSVFCGLGGHALQVGGSCFIGYGTLYCVRGISNSMTDALEYMPRLFNNPEEFGRNLVVVHSHQDGGGDANNIDQTKTFIDLVKSYGIKTLLVVGTIGIGVLLKKTGRVLNSVETIDMIGSFAGAQ